MDEDTIKFLLSKLKKTKKKKKKKSKAKKKSKKEKKAEVPELELNDLRRVIMRGEKSLNIINTFTDTLT